MCTYAQLYYTVFNINIQPHIPEERIPWDPPKKKLSKKLRSLSIHNEGVIKLFFQLINDMFSTLTYLIMFKNNA